MSTTDKEENLRFMEFLGLVPRHLHAVGHNLWEYCQIQSGTYYSKRSHEKKSSSLPACLARKIDLWCRDFIDDDVRLIGVQGFAIDVE